MTVIACPWGCGGSVDTGKYAYCPACRRPLNASAIVIPEEWPEDRLSDLGPNDCMVSYKLSWCWEWWGPPDHRMRCRLPKGHDGEHDTHERRSTTAIVSTDGQMVKA